MKAKLRGLQNIATNMKKGLIGRPIQMRIQDEHEIFGKLDQLNREKQRLDIEKTNYLERIKQVEARLRQIEKIEKSLRHQLTEIEDAKGKIAFEAHAQDVKHFKQTADDKRRELVIKY